MEPLAYLQLQMRLEGKAFVREHFIRQVEAVPGEETTLVLIAQLANKEVTVYYDEAISFDLQKELDLTIFSIEFPNVDSLLNVLRSSGIHFESGHYKTYVFPPFPRKDTDVICLSKHDSKIKAFGFDGFAENIYAIEHDDNLVSACVSTRENKQCGEAWVYTDPAFRNQGLAQKVVSAWAGSLLEASKVPFYSHKIENTASAKLAEKLGLQAVFEEIAITQI
jgi:RimJ/RimL family protein N-acetyltransferase